MQSVCGLCFSVISIIIIMKVKTVEKRMDLLYDHESDQDADVRKVKVIANSFIERPTIYGIIIPIDKHQHLVEQFETDFRHWNYMPKEGEAIIELPQIEGKYYSLQELEKLIDEFITKNKVIL